jgi:chromosome segregation ATPase
LSKITQTLNEIEEQLIQLDEQINSHCIAWAQEYIEKLAANECPDDIKALQADIEDITQKQNRFDDLVEKRESALKKQKTIKSTESEELKSRSDIYQVLGRRAFELYKKGAIQETEGLSKIFNPLLDWENVIRDADNELYRIRSGEEKQNAIKKFGTFLKRSSQTTKKKSAGDNLNKHYSKAGEMLIKEGYFTEIAQNGLSDIYDEFQDKEKHSRKLQEEQMELISYLAELDCQIDELSEGQRLHKAIKSLDEQKEEKDNDLDNAFLFLGKSLYGGESDSGSFREILNELNQEREKLTKSKNDCLTEIRLEKLTEKLEESTRDRDKQKEKVEKETEKWNSIKKEVQDLENTIKQLEKGRELEDQGEDLS